jgi:hypothetical protein
MVLRRRRAASASHQAANVGRRRWLREKAMTSAAGKNGANAQRAAALCTPHRLRSRIAACALSRNADLLSAISFDACTLHSAP